jgi:hypothetical protein
MGLIPSDENLSSYQIDCTVSNVWPQSDLNLLAIDNLTISGTKLPWDVSRSDIEITFDNNAATNCVPQVSQTDELVCLTQPFNIDEAGNTVRMSININGVNVQNDLSFNLMT